MSDISEQYLPWPEAAKKLGVSKRTLARWHALGIGPPRVKVGRKILYSIDSLTKWLKEKEKPACRA